MWGKVLAGGAVVLAFALAAFLGHQMIASYGDARYAAGRAEGQAAQLPAILAANAAAAKVALDVRDHIIAAEMAHASETARLLPLILKSNDEVIAYAATDAGNGACLDAERVRDIEASRAALFPAAATNAPRDDRSGPLPADAAGEGREGRTE